MTSIPIAYRLAVAAARAAAPVLARSDSKLGRGMAGRRDAHGVLMAWAEARRDPARPLVWFHAPSVGEGLQARAVMRAFRALRPDLQVAYTYFSPSAEPLGRSFGADVAGYLPWDQGDLVGPVLDALAPDLLVFTKTEVWPVLVAEAADRGVPVALAAGTVPDDAGRLKWPATAVLRGTWGRLSAGLACSEPDAEGLRRLGVPPDAVHVTGDPAIDSAAERVRSADPDSTHLRCLRDAPAPTVVVGSSWPSDERVLLPALTALRGEVPGLRVVLAPHEPSADRVGALLGSFIERGWHPSTLLHLEEDGGAADAIVVERVGVLADLYTAGTVAFVGGGFHGAGLHSVLEPAAAGLPVVIGPRHRNARAAGELVAAGAAEVVADADGAHTVLRRWLTDQGAKTYAGARALEYIGAHRGAADRSARVLASLVQHSRTP